MRNICLISITKIKEENIIRFVIIKHKYHYHDTFHKTRTKLSQISFHSSPNLAQQRNASPPPHSSLHFAPSFASAKPYCSLQLGSRRLHQRIARANMVTWLIDATRSRLPTGITRKSLEDRGCTRKESQFSPLPFFFSMIIVSRARVVEHHMGRFLFLEGN